ncbi:MAG: DsbA family protein [Holosporaceae bacterium]|jgi:protein-disulfide isomerase|nr:DsbA family protein [Holosporaceae bacterium]
MRFYNLLSFLVCFFASISTNAEAVKQASNSVRHSARHGECKNCKKAKRGMPQKAESFDDGLRAMNIPENYRLPEIIIGKSSALHKVTIYMSFTCGHCREFHDKEFPKFRKRYVDTGHVKVCLKFYIDDPGALESAIIVRCFGGKSTEKIESLAQKMFNKQQEWMRSSDPKQFLRDIFVNSGYTRAQVEKCIADSSISAGLMKDLQEAKNKRGIRMVPAFYFGESAHNGVLTSEQLAQKMNLN